MQKLVPSVLDKGSSMCILPESFPHHTMSNHVLDLDIFSIASLMPIGWSSNSKFQHKIYFTIWSQSTFQFPLICFHYILIYYTCHLLHRLVLFRWEPVIQISFMLVYRTTYFYIWKSYCHLFTFANLKISFTRSINRSRFEVI